ncbi:hypothetical protein [Sphingobium aromaticiconvertens]|uniref:PAS domain-containing protein n=1 Tax=Sphingobium aromaticiconvertens TaxID=365341 RepID=UPI0030188BAD
MDTLRGHDVANDQDDFDYAADAAIETPPVVVSDERRMHVRAYNYWASMLGERTLPSIEDLNPDELEDFGPNSVLLDFSAGIDNPAIVYLGTALRHECEIEGSITHINDVPARSLLSRLTDHYLQIIANAAPIGFEAEFVNQRGSEILYRGILMPFSSDDDTIDFVYGVINWKEVASHDLTDALVSQVEEALRSAPARRNVAPVWADGPVGSGIDTDLPELDDEPLDLSGMESPSSDAPLADWLALARDGADEARRADSRSHTALYRAIGFAHDFAIASIESPQDYEEMLADAGIKVQARSPMTPIVKLVFGATYDKTRLTEYATALDHAQASGLGLGALADHLNNYPGGIKALVRDVRAERRAEKPARPDSRTSARATLKAAQALEPQAVTTDTDGLAVVVARREADGSLSIVAALSGTSPLSDRVVAQAAKQA